MQHPRGTPTPTGSWSTGKPSQGSVDRARPSWSRSACRPPATRTCHRPTPPWESRAIEFCPGQGLVRSLVAGLEAIGRTCVAITILRGRSPAPIGGRDADRKAVDDEIGARFRNVGMTSSPATLQYRKEASRTPTCPSWPTDRWMRLLARHCQIDETTANLAACTRCRKVRNIRGGNLRSHAWVESHRLKFFGFGLTEEERTRRLECIRLNQAPATCADAEKKEQRTWHERSE